MEQVTEANRGGGASRPSEGARPIVVGVDGSDASIAALRWAADHRSGSPLVAVATWEFPITYGEPVAWPGSADFEADARQVLRDSVERAVGEERAGEVISSVLHGQPIAVLEEFSRSASLVVVGCRGHGELSGMLLGSVSEYLATHAHCPVVIVRGDDVVDPSSDHETASRGRVRPVVAGDRR